MKAKATPPHRIARACECGAHGFVGFKTWHVALFDANKTTVVASHYWTMCKAYSRHAYAESKASRTILHRLLTDAAEGFVVDHINGDTMDNRSANLRVCSHAQNMRNRRKHSGTKSTFKGVYRCSNGWASEAAKGGVRIRKSGFKTELEAALFYDAAAKELHGEFAKTNASMGLIRENRAARQFFLGEAT